MKLSTIFLCSILLLALSATAFAQLTGTKTIPGDYATLAAAIADLNAQGVGSGGVTFNVAAGYTETAPAGGFVITAQGTAANPIVFQKSGSGADPTFTAPAPQTVGNLNDAIFKLVGADYVTLDRFTMLENAANSVTTAASNDMTEWGVALLSADSTNGAQNNTIKNCTIQLKRIYQNTFGIYSNATHTSTSISTALGGTTPAVSHSGLTIHGNTIDSVNIGIVVVGPTAATAHNDGLDIGGSSAATGNTIIRYGTTGTFSSYLNVSGTVNGILVRNTKNFNISYNTIQSSNGGTTSGTLRGIFVPSFNTAPTGTFTNNINNNSISLRSAVATGAMLGIAVESGTSTITSTTNINDNDLNTTTHTVAASGTITFISHVGSSTAGPLTVNINNNTFTGLSVNTTGSVTFISNSWTGSAGFTKNVNGNQIVSGFAKTGAGGTVTLYTNSGSDPAGSFENNNNNNFSNITVTGATTIAGWSNTNGGAPTKTVSNNTFSDWTGGTSAVTGMTINFDGGPTTVSGNTVSNITSGGAITGISFGSTGAGTTNASQNTVHSLTSTGAAAVTGISVAGGTTRTLFKNKIYSLEANNASGTVNGILISGGTTVSVYNNLIGDLRAPVTSSTTDAIRGINISAATASSTRDISYNTIYINATSSGANFSTSGIFHTYSATATSATLNMRNNVIVNTSTPNGTGVTAAFRRSAATDLNNYGTASNNNLFYAGTPGAANLIYTDGTNNDQTLADFKNRVAPREALSVTELPPFLSTTGSDPTFLHISTTTPTRLESGGTPVAGITDDYDGDARNSSTPDIGADEFAGIAIDEVAPSISYTPLLNTSSTAARTLTATITDPSGVPTSGIGLPVIYWRVNSGSYTGTQGVFVSGNQYSFTFGAGVTAGDTVYYYIAAQDAASPPNVGVQPSAGAGGFSADPPAAATPPTTPTSYIILQPPLSGDYTVGAGSLRQMLGLELQKFTRRVMREVDVPSNSPQSGLKKHEEPEVLTIGPTSGVFMEVEEEYWAWALNGKPFDLSSSSLESTTDYPTLTAAIADFNTRGVSGPTRFLLVDPAYPEAGTMTISGNPSEPTTATNTLTIKPNVGVTASVTVTSTSPVFVITTNFVTIDGSNDTDTRDLTIINNGTGASSGVAAVTGSGVTLKNLIGMANLPTQGYGILLSGAVNATVQNCHVKRAILGIQAQTAANNVTIVGNDIGSTTVGEHVQNLGILMLSTTNYLVARNTIHAVSRPSTAANYGIGVAWQGGTNPAPTPGVISSNTITNVKHTGVGLSAYAAYGIYLSSNLAASDITVFNNMISDIWGDGDGSAVGFDFTPQGIFVHQGGGYKIYYNSVNMFGALGYSGSTNVTTGALTVRAGAGVENLDVRNNILVNSQTIPNATGPKATYAIHSAVANIQFTNIDHNLYYSTGPQAAFGFMAPGGAVSPPNLSGWQTASGQDANSVEGNPQFLSATDLHINTLTTSPANNAGTPIVGITTDFDGDLRDATNPDIGADEFVPVTYTLTVTVDPPGAGTVDLDPPGGTYNHGTEVELTATPNTGYTFTGWSGDLSGNTNPETILMDGNKNVTAHFALITYTLEVTIVGSGSVDLDPPGGTYNHGTNVTLTAVPDAGWVFSGWSGDLSGNTNPETILMDANKNVTATFVSATPVTFLSLEPDSIFNEDPAKPGKSMKPAKRGKGLMPNWSNLLAETVLQGGFAPGASESDDAGGMVIGVSHMEEVAPDKWKPIKDSANVRAWVRLSKWNFKKEVGTGWAALQKTLRNKEFNHYDSDPTLTARGFDSTGYPGLAGRKPMKKQLSKLDPKKTPNKLFAELVALKFNIAASQMEKTPAGFGDLIYVNPSSGFDGMSVMDISAAANQMMTYWQGVDQADYDDLYSVVYAINRAFLGPIDTVSFEDGGKLVLNGAVDINAVPFLELPPGPRPFVATTLTPRNSYVEGFEDDFADEEWDEMEGVPIAAKLYQNYPNPFNPSTTISFKLRNDSYVTLKIFNVLGQEVMTLLNGEELEEGYQTVEFRADRLASGVYFYHLRVEDVDGELDRTVVTKKMLLLK